MFSFAFTNKHVKSGRVEDFIEDCSQILLANEAVERMPVAFGMKSKAHKFRSK